MNESFRAMTTNFNNQPIVEIINIEFKVEKGWKEICERLNDRMLSIGSKKKFITIETYQGVIHEEILGALMEYLRFDRLILAEEFYLPEKEIEKLVHPDMTDDRIFGFLTKLALEEYFDPEKIKQNRFVTDSSNNEIIVLYGCGSSLLMDKFNVNPEWNLLVYADMARWEIQGRMR